MWECKWRGCRVFMAWERGVATHWLSLTPSSPPAVLEPGAQSAFPSLAEEAACPRATAWSLGVLRTAEAERLSCESLDGQHICLSVLQGFLSLPIFTQPPWRNKRLEKTQRKVYRVREQFQAEMWQTYAPECGKAETQCPHSPGWESLQPPLRYTLYLLITGNYKDVNVIIEWLNPFHPWDWLGLIISSSAEFAQSHSLKNAIQILSSMQEDLDKVGSTSVPAGTLNAESDRSDVHFILLIPTDS